MNSRSPVFGNSPIAAAPPSRGLNHHAFTFDDGGDLVMVFLAWPFADSPEWNVKLRIAPGQERDVKMHRQWPMLRVFSKSNPKYGLPALSR